MNIENIDFLPDFIEQSGKLYYSFPTGVISEVPPNETEISILPAKGEVGGLDPIYMKWAFYDQCNPVVLRDCSNCDRGVMRNVINNNRNYYVCKCGEIDAGNFISI